MTDLRYTVVDAFAARPFTGNPAAVMPLDAWLDDALLQAIAAEHNLSETAFIIPDATGAADYELRWFTPRVEVALCGHATLASGHVLLSADAALGGVSFRTRQAGVLRVDRAGAGYALALPAWAPAPHPLPDFAAVMGGPVAATLWREQRYAVFVYPDAASVRALTPDFAALKAGGNTLYIATAPGDDTDVISRCFAPAAGIDEDPVTGSAHAVITPYWCDRLGRAQFTAHQASARGGDLSCALDGDRVILGGQCVTVACGVMTL